MTQDARVFDSNPHAARGILLNLLSRLTFSLLSDCGSGSEMWSNGHAGPWSAGHGQAEVSGRPPVRRGRRYRAVWLRRERATVSGVPETTTRPPSSPAPGPRSTTQ